MIPTATVALEIGAQDQKERPYAPPPLSRILGYATEWVEFNAPPETL